MDNAARCRAGGLLVGLLGAYALCHNDVTGLFALALLPLFAVVGALLGEVATARPLPGPVTTASLRTRRMWHDLPLPAVVWVALSLAGLASLRLLPVDPANHVVYQTFYLMPFENNSVRNNVVFGLILQAIFLAFALLALWFLPRARSGDAAMRRRTAAVIGNLSATISTLIFTAEALWISTAQFEYTFADGNPWLGLAVGGCAMAGLLAFAWFATAFIRSPAPAPAAAETGPALVTESAA